MWKYILLGSEWGWDPGFPFFLRRPFAGTEGKRKFSIQLRYIPALDKLQEAAKEALLITLKYNTDGYMFPRC